MTDGTVVKDPVAEERGPTAFIPIPTRQKQEQYTRAVGYIFVPLSAVIAVYFVFFVPDLRTIVDKAALMTYTDVVKPSKRGDKPW